MKKLIFLASALAGLFLAASCQQENLEPVMSGNTVTYTVQVPENIATKADGNGFTLYYEVYRQGDVTELDADPVYEGTKTFENGSADVELEFVKDQEFTVLFWAQKTEGAQAYDITDLREVSLKALVANDLTAEVFAGNDHVSDCKSDKDGNVVLVRPVAQLNIATTAAGLTLGAANSANSTTVSVNPATSMVVVDGLYGTYNVATGYAVTEAPAVKKSRTYTAATVPGTDFKGTYKLMATNYLGFIPQDGDNVEVTFTIYTEKDGNIEHTVSNVPVKANYQTNILGNLISATTDYHVTLEDWSNAEITYATNAEAVQAALDNAAAGTIIKLHPGVNYGTLYMRPVEGGAQTKVVDWIGNNYRFETYSLFENITILGAEGATVDAIEIEGGTYYNTEHSQAATYPVMLSLVELRNVVFDGVTFTGKGGYDPQGYGNAVNLSGSNIKVDGLTFKNCVLNNSENNARLLYKTESTTHVHNYSYDGQDYTFIPSLKDITIRGCTFNGGYMGLELRETENVTITNNEFKVGDRNILLAVNTGCTYSGNITITGNVSNNAKERFVRADGTGDAVVVISDNTIINYEGEDSDYIKVTNGNNVTIENNEKVLGVKTWDEFTAALAAGETGLILTADIEYASNYQLQKSVILNLGGYSMTLPMINIHTKTTVKNGTINGKVYARKNAEIVFDNVKFSGAVADNLSTEGHLAIQGGCKSLYAKDCLFSPTSVSGSQTKPLSFEGGSTQMKFENCEFKSSPYKKQVYLNSLSATGSLEFINCNFNNKTPNIMFAAACPLTNLKMSGTTKLGSVTLETNRAKDAVTADDLAYLRTMIENNSISNVRLFYAGGLSEYIR